MVQSDSPSYCEVTHGIRGDPGAVRWGRTKLARQKLKSRKFISNAGRPSRNWSFFRQFPNGSANAGPWWGAKNKHKHKRKSDVLVYCIEEVWNRKWANYPFCACLRGNADSGNEIGMCSVAGSLPQPWVLTIMPATSTGQRPVEQPGATFSDQRRANQEEWFLPFLTPLMT